MKRKAIGRHEDDDDSSDDDDEADDEFAQSADNLQVFCIASTDYMKLTQTNPDGPPMVKFMTINFLCKSFVNGGVLIYG